MGVHPTPSSTSARANPPRPREGGGVHPDGFSVTVKNAFDIKLQFGIADPSFNPDLLSPVPFSYQVTLLTYDIIGKHLHGPKVPRFRSAFKAIRP